MKTINKISFLFLSFIIFTSCESEYKLSIKAPSKAILEDQIKISLFEENNFPVDEVTFFVNGKEMTSTNLSFTLDTKNYGTGKLIVSAMVAYGDQKSKRVNTSIEILSNIPFTSYDFKIINTYPHDSNAYTQGLEFYNGFLYETT